MTLLSGLVVYHCWFHHYLIYVVNYYYCCSHSPIAVCFHFPISSGLLAAENGTVLQFKACLISGLQLLHCNDVLALSIFSDNCFFSCSNCSFICWFVCTTCTFSAFSQDNKALTSVFSFNNWSIHCCNTTSLLPAVCCGCSGMV